MATKSFFRTLVRLTLLAGLAAVAAASHPTGAGIAKQNLVDVHANTEKRNNKECLACHAGVLKERSGDSACAKKASNDKKCGKYHPMHLASKLATPKICTDCHQSIDLRNGSAAALRRQVDPQICAGCHSGGMKGAKVLYAQ